MKRKIVTVVLMLLILWLATTGWIFFRVIQFSSLDLAARADAIVVLGAAQYAGKPSPVLEARLDHAFTLFKKNFAPLIITTGGRSPGDKFSEGEVGEKYLEMKGVPTIAIIAESISLTTQQNIMSIAKIAQEKKLTNIIFVSDPFHMYRARMIASDFGISALTSPTLQSPISQNRWLEAWYIGREIALVFAHKLLGI